MRTVIVDDEMLARALVREYLTEHPDVEIVAECANGFEAVKAITELAPDLVLLDIQMPGLDGFEVVELAGSAPRYIFATAFDQYAIKAFECHALDYLLKPYSQQRLDQALAHARANLAQRAAMRQASAQPASTPPAPTQPASAPAGDALPDTVSAAATQQDSSPAIAAIAREAAARKLPLARVLVRDGATVHVIPSERIDYIEAQDDYVQIRAEGRSYLKNQRLAELEAQLDGTRFLRIHRSWIVNLACVARIEQATRDSHVAVLKDGNRLPVSRSGYQKARAALGQL